MKNSINLISLIFKALGKIMCSIGLLTSFCVVLTTDLYGEERRNYGKEWQNLSSFERALYLGGFQEGVYAGIYPMWKATGQLSPSENEKKSINQIALTSRQQVALRHFADQYKIDIASFGTTPVAAVITNLYLNPANAFIPWPQIVEIALMRLQGVSEDKIQRELEINRRVVTELLKNK